MPFPPSSRLGPNPILPPQVSFARCGRCSSASSSAGRRFSRGLDRAGSLSGRRHIPAGSPSQGDAVRLHFIFVVVSFQFFSPRSQPCRSPAGPSQAGSTRRSWRPGRGRGSRPRGGTAGSRRRTLRRGRGRGSCPRGERAGFRWRHRRRGRGRAGERPAPVGDLVAKDPVEDRARAGLLLRAAA